MYIIFTTKHYTHKNTYIGKIEGLQYTISFHIQYRCILLSMRGVLQCVAGNYTKRQTNETRGIWLRYENTN